MINKEQERAHAVWEMLGAAIDGDSAEAARRLQAIGSTSTSNQMYGVCCAIAEAGTAVLRQIYPAMVWAPSRCMFALGELQPGGLNADPAATWAARFLVAYANGDTDMTNALFSAALAAPGCQYTESVCALLATFAGLGRAQLRRKGLLT